MALRVVGFRLLFAILFLHGSLFPNSSSARFRAEICGRRLIEDGRIAGGNETSIRDHPWQVGLQIEYKNRIFCGGVLINKEWVVTAAHCITRYWPSINGCVAGNFELTVVLGESDQDNIDGHEIQKPVTEVCIHQQHNRYNLDRDIALLRLARPLSGYSETMSPVCLPTSSSQFPVGTTCVVSGWGQTHKHGCSSGKLRAAHVKILDHTICGKLYKEGEGKIVTDRMICAGYLEGKVDTCKGDSGGPLVCKEGDRYVLAGITSWGRDCARARRPGVYTDIKKFLVWIQALIKSHAEKDL